MDKGYNMSNIDEFYNIVTAEDLANTHLKESVYDSGDIGHPLKNTINYDIDVELENRNKEPINDRSIEAVKEGYLSKEDFMKKHIDIVKSDFGEDLELEPTDVNLVYRSIVSDPDYDSYDINKKEISDYLNKTLREGFLLKRKESKKIQVSEQNSIMGYNYNDLKSMLRTEGKDTYISIRKNDVLIEGVVVKRTEDSILFEHENRRYNIIK